ncbi:MAG: hypothetical protein ABIJ59_19690 [Pseudomonadota bacterium]
MNKLIHRITFWLFLSLILIIFPAFVAIAAPTENTKDSSIIKIAIVPFETHSKNDISYIVKGVTNMLHSRLDWKNKIEIVPKTHMTELLSTASLPPNSTIGNQSIVDLGKKTGADYVITGVITEFYGAYSIDTKIYKLKDKSYYTFFGQAKTIDTIVTQVNIICAKINKKVFDRTTSSYEKFEKEKKISTEELRRMNPERMMPPNENIDGEEKKWWKKIW